MRKPSWLEDYAFDHVLKGFVFIHFFLTKVFIALPLWEPGTLKYAHKKKMVELGNVKEH